MCVCVVFIYHALPSILGAAGCGFDQGRASELLQQAAMPNTPRAEDPLSHVSVVYVRCLLMQ